MARAVRVGPGVNAQTLTATPKSETTLTTSPTVDHSELPYGQGGIIAGTLITYTSSIIGDTLMRGRNSIERGALVRT
jgi:hypothetical protein